MRQISTNKKITNWVDLVNEGSRCLDVNFRCCVKFLTFWNFTKLPETCNFWIRFSVLAIALWECMSAYSWYYGLSLSFEIRSKALTAHKIWQFKGFLQKHCLKIWVQEVNKLPSTPSSTLGEFHIFSGSWLKCK